MLGSRHEGSVYAVGMRASLRRTDRLAAVIRADRVGSWHAVAAILLLSLLLSPTPGWAQVFVGRVIGVADGDTLSVLVDRHPLRVRLADIDAPERRQPYGERAREALSQLVFGRQVEVTVKDTDRYGRSVARIVVGQTWVNAALVQSGSAWVYRRYSSDPTLLALEQGAQQQHRGLWALPPAQQVPPWEWRAAERHR